MFIEGENIVNTVFLPGVNPAFVGLKMHWNIDEVSNDTQIQV